MIAILTFSGESLQAQACCSAGAPILGSLQLSSSDAGNAQVAVSYEYNSLQDVINISDPLNDQSRERYTHSLMLEGNYGVSHRLSVSGLLTLVQQGRTITTPTGSQNRLVTGGMGDAVLLMNYNLIPGNVFTQKILSIGTGPKIPLGQSDQRSNGILVPYDMQPGTGAWDAVFWGYFSQGFRPKPFSLFATTAYRMTGQNDLGYEFGNELQMLLGWSDSQNLGKLLYAYGLSFRYRHAAMDKNNHVILPNTGGQWIFLMPSLSWHLNQDISVTINAELPLYSEVEGTQLTPSARANIGMLWTFRKKPKLEDIFKSKISVK